MREQREIVIVIQDVREVTTTHFPPQYDRNRPAVRVTPPSMAGLRRHVSDIEPVELVLAVENVPVNRKPEPGDPALVSRQPAALTIGVFRFLRSSYGKSEHTESISKEECTPRA